MVEVSGRRGGGRCILGSSVVTDDQMPLPEASIFCFVVFLFFSSRFWLVDQMILARVSLRAAIHHQLNYLVG